MTSVEIAPDAKFDPAINEGLHPDVVTLSGGVVVARCMEPLDGYLRTVDTTNPEHAMQAGETVYDLTVDEAKIYIGKADTLVLIPGSRHTRLGGGEVRDRADTEKALLHPASEPLPGGRAKIWELGGVIQDNILMIWGDRAAKEGDLARAATIIPLPYDAKSTSPVANAYDTYLNQRGLHR